MLSLLLHSDPTGEVRAKYGAPDLLGGLQLGKDPTQHPQQVEQR